MITDYTIKELAREFINWHDDYHGKIEVNLLILHHWLSRHKELLIEEKDCYHVSPKIQNAVKKQLSKDGITFY
jgi:hypothetical protein